MRFVVIATSTAICHAEQSEASVSLVRETLRFAQGDNPTIVMLSAAKHLVVVNTSAAICEKFAYLMESNVHYPGDVQEQSMAIITVSKLNSLGEIKIQYQGEMIERLADGIIIQAYWEHPLKDLGYTCFETGDRFTEYYYTHRWFNIFDISNASNERKGWYCNIAEPADICDDQIKQIDLLLDVWVDPWGTPLLLDEDEFEVDTTLDNGQRQGARQGLHDLLQMIAAQTAPFSYKPLAEKQSV